MENLKLFKDWGVALFEDLGQRIQEESSSTVLNLAQIYESQLRDIEANEVYQNEKLQAIASNGVERATGNLLESYNLLQKNGKLSGLTLEEKDQIAEIVIGQMEPLSESQLALFDKEGAEGALSILSEELKADQELTEGVVAGDHGYDATRIAAGDASGNFVNAGPTVMGMVRRAVPKLIALDFCGVQALKQPSGQIFGVRAVYGNNDLADPTQGFDPEGKEMFHPELGPDVMQSGLGSHVTFEDIEPGKQLENSEIYRFKFQFDSEEDREDEKYASLLFLGESGIGYFQVNKEGGLTVPADGDLVEWIIQNTIEGTLFETGAALATSISELMKEFNNSVDNEWSTVSFRIDKSTHEAKERKLKATATTQSIQDLRSHLGMDVISMLQNIIVDELALQINREIINWVNASAEMGKSGRTRTAGSRYGVFDLFDPVDNRRARHNAESAKALLYQIDKERNEILRRTGLGRGNVLLVSPGVATLLLSIPDKITDAQIGFAEGGNLDYAQSTYVGTINGMRVHMDQFARYEYFTVGYRGSQPIDAGLIFSPYIMLTPHVAQDYRSFAPVIGYSSRYALSVNPMVNRRVERPTNRISNGMPSADIIRKNSYYRHVMVANL